MITWHTRNTVMALRKHLEGRQRAIRQGLLKVADAAVANVRKGIPPTGHGIPGMENHFPGYAATGALSKAIDKGPLTNRGKNAYSIRVGLRGGTSKVRMYGVVHEYGIVIHAKGNGYMTFKVKGQWVRVREVWIRPKGYFHAGWGLTEREFEKLVLEHIVPRMYAGLSKT